MLNYQSRLKSDRIFNKMVKKLAALILWGFRYYYLMPGVLFLLQIKCNLIKLRMNNSIKFHYNLNILHTRHGSFSQFFV
jgi:hypothetical protein